MTATVTIAVSAQGATGTTYTIALVRDREHYLKSSDPVASGSFGLAMAISGETLVVAAPGANGNAGAVYVFVRSGFTWTQQARLTASNGEAMDGFGASVATSGDTVVVGAPGESSNSASMPSNNDAVGSGAVYVFVRAGTTWTQQAYLKASNIGGGVGGGQGDAFGAAVAVSGDTLVAGAPMESSGSPTNQADNSVGYAGAAYVFVRSGTAWTQQAYLKASTIQLQAEFAGQVAISGDTLAVGATCDKSSATTVNGDQTPNASICTGAAHVFVRTGTTWTQQAFVKPSVLAFRFGRAVALLGDTLAVGGSGDGTPTGLRLISTASSRSSSAAARAGASRGTSSRA
jgi:hypothetical protein